MACSTVKFTFTLLNTALEGGEKSAAHLGRFTPGKKARERIG
jgi:hypothetical protein